MTYESAPPVAGAAALPDPVELAVAERAKQRRWTVLLRGILVIPQVIVLAALLIAFEVVGVIGWFAALFTGRLPSWAADFMAGVLRWAARVYGYMYLLHDRYPPFSLELLPGEPVVLAVPPPGPLNRLAVLFRIVLALPAALAVSLVGWGLAVFGLVGWVAALITGWLPVPIFGATRSFLRYSLRFEAWL